MTHPEQLVDEHRGIACPASELRIGDTFLSVRFGHKVVRAVEYLDGNRIRIEWADGFFEGAATAEVRALWGTSR